MLNITTKITLVSGLLFLLLSCNNNVDDNNNKIKVDFEAPTENFTQLIESVEYVPLETDSVHFFDFKNRLILEEDRYVIADLSSQKICAYDLYGRFLNTIGRFGNGPGEHSYIISIQKYNDAIYVYSHPDKEIRYNRDGSFEEKHISLLGQDVLKISDGVFYYYSYGIPYPYRAALVRDTSAVEKYLFSDNNSKLFPAENLYPLLSSDSAEEAFLIDTYNPNILRYYKGELSDFLCLDFGKYKMPEEFFQFDDPYKAFDFWVSLETAHISSFSKCGDTYVVIVGGIYSKNGTEHYGIYRGGSWYWFLAPDFDGHWGPFTHSFKLIKDDIMYFLIEAAEIKHIPAEIAALALNPEAVANIKDEDNYVITKIKLK